MSATAVVEAAEQQRVVAQQSKLVEATEPDDEALYEIEYGRRVEVPMSVVSAIFGHRIAWEITGYVFEHQLGWVVEECLFILDAGRDLRRRPDVAFVSVQRWPLDKPLPATGDWPVVPDLAIEVLSPHDRFEKMVQKLREYFACGVRQVWVVMPLQRQVYIYSSPTQVRILGEAEELDGGEVVPGFRLKLGEYFASVPVEPLPLESDA